MPRGPQRQPIDPNLPPDTPLEPGSGTPRHKPGSAAARIAASEAALGHARPMGPETGGKSAAITAARNAAKAAYLDTPVKVPKSLGRKSPAWLRWPFKKAAKDVAAEPQIHAPAPAPAPVLPPVPAAKPAPTPSTMPPPLAIGRRRRCTALARQKGNETPEDAADRGQRRHHRRRRGADRHGIPVSGRAAHGRDAAQGPVQEPRCHRAEGCRYRRPRRAVRCRRRKARCRRRPIPSGPTPSAANRCSIRRPLSSCPTLPARSRGSPYAERPRYPAARRPVIPNIDALPASISPILRTAALANDPAAQYELGARYAEGRGFQQSMPEAVRWLERAAEAGFAPAQFRLASLNEKGEGLKKDVQAPAGFTSLPPARGTPRPCTISPCSMPRASTASPTTRRRRNGSARPPVYGVTDSQYNLAILFARGIGVQANLAESYRWFALAAANGDNDAAKKRDEVAARLDQKTLAAAKLAAQSFAPEREPDEATNLKAPPGGWDHVPAAPAKPRR
jgi:localization factor PodJL